MDACRVTVWLKKKIKNIMKVKDMCEDYDVMKQLFSETTSHKWYTQFQDIQKLVNFEKKSVEEVVSGDVKFGWYPQISLGHEQGMCDSV